MAMHPSLLQMQFIYNISWRNTTCVALFFFITVGVFQTVGKTRLVENWLLTCGLSRQTELMLKTRVDLNLVEVRVQLNPGRLMLERRTSWVRCKHYRFVWQVFILPSGSGQPKIYSCKHLEQVLPWPHVTFRLLTFSMKSFTYNISSKWFDSLNYFQW